MSSGPETQLNCVASLYNVMIDENFVQINTEGKNHGARVQLKTFLLHQRITKNTSSVGGHCLKQNCIIVVPCVIL